MTEQEKESLWGDNRKFAAEHSRQIWSLKGREKRLMTWEGEKHPENTLFRMGNQFPGEKRKKSGKTRKLMKRRREG